MMNFRPLFEKVNLLIIPVVLILVLGFSIGSAKARANIQKPTSANKEISTRNSAFYNVKDYGAAGNGKTLDTQAINKTINAAAEAGGGTVLVPAGTYLSGSIELKSNISLYLEQGATIEAVFDTTAYNDAEPFEGPQYQDFGHTHFHNSLIWGENLHDISIRGQGLIDGQNLSRDLDKRDNLPHGLGNKAIAFKNCRNVVIEDISMFKGGHFAILATGIDNLTIKNLKIDTKRDGIDIDACRNVHITNCTINSPWDDAIVLKASYALGRLKATENVTISDCIVSGDYELGSVLDGTFKRFPEDAHIPNTGRIKLGTESNGDFKNITITNCVFDHCGGLALESVDGAHIEDVAISNITMRGIINMPIFLRLGSRMRGPDSLKIGSMKRVNIGNIVVSNSASRAASTISGIPGYNIENVNIHDIQFNLRGGGSKELGDIEVPEKEDGYPEPTMFGTLPAYGFYVRHAEGIDFENITISTQKKELRPAFMFKDASDIDLYRVELPKVSETPTFRLEEVNDFKMTNIDGYKNKKLTGSDNRTF